MRRLAALLAVAALAVLLWLAVPREQSARTRTGVAGAPEAVDREPPATPATVLDIPDETVVGTGQEARGVRRVDGTVKTEEGVPIRGAEVRALVAERPVATTGAEGTYVLPKLPAGSYPLRASAEGYAAIERQVTVGPLGEHVHFVLHPSAPILGRVVDQQGMPIEGARLRAVHAADSRAVLAERATDADGAFAFDDAYAGDWWVRLTPPDEGLFTGARQVLITAGGPPLRLVLRRREGEHKLVLEAVGPDGMERPITAAFLRVEDRPLAPLSAVIVRGSAVVPRIAAGRWRAEITTAADGTVHRILDLPPGAGEVRRRIEIGKRGTITGHVDVTGLASSPSELVLAVNPRGAAQWVPPPQPEEVLLLASPPILVPILDAENGYAFRLESVQPGEPVDVL